MDRAEFWTRIAHARQAAHQDGTADDVARALVGQLKALPPATIEAFQGRLTAYYGAANRKELWAAASFVGGGCSDDGFDYFRGWLIAQGETVYLAALHDPSSLADHRWPGDDEQWPRIQCERILSVARVAYEELTGEAMSWDLEEPSVEEVSDLPGDRISDYEWTEDDVVRLFPRLAERWPRRGSADDAPSEGPLLPDASDTDHAWWTSKRSSGRWRTRPVLKEAGSHAFAVSKLREGIERLMRCEPRTAGWASRYGRGVATR